MQGVQLASHNFGQLQTRTWVGASQPTLHTKPAIRAVCAVISKFADHASSPSQSAGAEEPTVSQPARPSTMEQPPIMTTMPASGSKTQWAKPQDWDRYRNTITALFMCHSLPVVMRIMREEHQFHATPKMFQSQIYQKWGLRKTKPGEAKKEAKERKRRREQSEDAESIASSSHSLGRRTAENLSVSNKSLVSNSTSEATSCQAPTDNTRFASVSLDNQAVPSANAETSQPENDGDSSGSTTIPPDPQAAVPKAWMDFLSNGQAPPQLESNQDTSAAAVPGPQKGSENLFSIDGTVNSNDSGSWISTVMLPTPPNSVVQHPRVPSSVKSRSSHSSARSRASRASPSYEEDAVFSRGFKRARTMAGIENPMGSINCLETPTTLLLPERSMFFARHFISSTFSTGLWALSQSTDPTLFDTECGKLERWYNDFNPAFDFLRKQKVRKAFRILKRCFANTKTFIEPQDPRVVIYVCQQAIRCMFYDTLGRNLSQTLLKYIAGLCLVLFGANHPLHIMLSQLSRMDSFEFAQNIRPFLDCYFDHLEPFLEQSDNAFGHITEMRGLTISLMEATGMMGIYEAKPVLDALIRKSQSHGLPNLYLMVETAAILHRNRFFKEALSLLAQVRESEEAPAHPYEFHYAGIVLVLTLQKMKDMDGAIRAEYELAEFLTRPLSSHPGYPDQLSISLRQYMESRQSSLILILGKLEKDLREVGRIEEADEIQGRLDRGVAHEYGVEEAGGDVGEEVSLVY
ncbi:hypothetical protein SCUP515_01043 [Seiridium cupressi]